MGRHSSTSSSASGPAANGAGHPGAARSASGSTAAAWTRSTPVPPTTRPSAVRRALSGLLSLVVLAVVALALAMTVVPAIAGATGLTVLSPSMTPTLGVGSFVVVRPEPVDGLAVGDVVSFTDREPSTGATRTVTHRVVGIEDGPSFRTKGDANADPDQRAVAAADVIGVEWYSVPKVGGWLTSLTSGPGLVIAAGVLLLLVAGWLLAPRRSRR
ncbi:signal peptidase [Pseudonocardia sediminis]|uniref:Signal peptidase I n=1 Tax=Pseudonocardia sediminis TaxID=1397368 RepID=A0A4Q7V1A3_PSEST|nr:signal peptidase I [Pseudonocardia sediminis]RZT86363.1 signal peptidase [Pseudonocardia sediminis]